MVRLVAGAPRTRRTMVQEPSQLGGASQQSSTEERREKDLDEATARGETVERDERVVGAI